MPPKKVHLPPPAAPTVAMDSAIIMGPGVGQGAGIAALDDETPQKQDLIFREGINIEDLNLPKSIVTRLAKGVLPPNTQIQGNAMLAMTKSATVFVNYLASQANEFAASSNRKTIAPQDVFAALDEAQLSDFKPRLEAELAKFNEIQADKRNAYKNKVASNKAAGTTTAQGDHEAESEMERDGAQRASKKARMDPDESAMDVSGMTAGDGEKADGERTGDEEGNDETEEDDEEDEGEERPGDEERDEEKEEGDEEDEALDNGEDSD